MLGVRCTHWWIVGKMSIPLALEVQARGPFEHPNPKHRSRHPDETGSATYSRIPCFPLFGTGVPRNVPPPPRTT